VLILKWLILPHYLLKYRDYEIFVHANVTAALYGPVGALLFVTLKIVLNEPKTGGMLWRYAIPTLGAVGAYYWTKYVFYKRVRQQIEEYVDRGGHPNIVVCYLRSGLVLFTLLAVYRAVFIWLPLKLLSGESQ
jgi:hypothetical protein